MSSKKILVLVSAVMMMMASAPSWAVNIGIVGMATLDTPSVTGKTGTIGGGQFGFPGGGILIEFPLGMRVGFEIDGLLNNSVWSDSSTGVNQQSYSVEPVALFRLHFNRYITLGLGGYYGMALGSLGNTSNTKTVGYAQYQGGLSTSDFGAEASLGITIPLGKDVGFYLDARYLYGLDNQATKGTWDTAAIQGLAGFQFFLGHAR